MYRDEGVRRIAFGVCTDKESEVSVSFDESEVEKKERIIALVASYIPDTYINYNENDSQPSESLSNTDNQVNIEDNAASEEEKTEQNLFIGKWNYSNAKSIAEEVCLEFSDTNIVEISKARETYIGTYEIMEPGVATFNITENVIYDNSTASENRKDCNIFGTVTIHDNLLDYSMTYEDGWIEEVNNLVKDNNTNVDNEYNQINEEFEPGYLSDIKSLSDFGLQLYDRDLWDWEPKDFVDACNNEYSNLQGYHGIYSTESNEAYVCFPELGANTNSEITESGSLNIKLYDKNDSTLNSIEVTGDSINTIYADRTGKLCIGLSGEEFIERILPDFTYTLGNEESKCNLVVFDEKGQRQTIGSILYYPDRQDKWGSPVYDFSISAEYRDKSIAINLVVNKETGSITYIKVEWK